MSSLRQAMNSVAVGKWSESWQGDRSWLGRSGHMSVTLLLGIEGLVFLAILLVVLRSSTDVGQSVWLLSGLSLAVLVLSWLRRRALSTW